MLKIVRTIPRSHGGVNRRALIRGAIGVAAECVKTSPGQQIFFFNLLGNVLRARLSIFDDVRVAGSLRKMSHRGARLPVKCGEINFLVWHSRRPRLHPSGAFGVLIDAVAIGVMSGSPETHPACHNPREAQ